MENKFIVWDFVEKYYPDYYRSDEIALADNLQKLLDEEVNGDAEELLKKEYNNNLKNPHIQLDYDSLHKEIYEKAIQGFIDKMEW